MPAYVYRPVANGLRTDHPVLDLPFADDSHIPVGDPEAIEATGRHQGTDTWGRFDHVGRSGGWAAFTTDTVRHDLGWLVRWHPDHGRSVLLYRDDDTAGAYDAFLRQALLFRVGGYWWDGTTWYRPDQVWDAAGEDWHHRPVPSASTVTAADMLAVGATHAHGEGRVLAIGNVTPDTPPPARAWIDDLALWARERGGAGLDKCVVTLTAPELGADQLVGMAEMAEIAGIAPSTLRAYIARGEADVPSAQAAPGGRSLWARPVAEDWAAARRRSAEGVTLAVSGRRGDPPVGVAQLQDWMEKMFYALLWEHPVVHRRWTRRWRTETAVREVAGYLGWQVAESLDRIVPHSLRDTIGRALLDELAAGQELENSVFDADHEHVYYGITPSTADMLGWLVRHRPASAAHIIGVVTGEAERRFGIPRNVTERSVATSLSLDGELDNDARRDFLSRVLSPDNANEAPGKCRA